MSDNYLYEDMASGEWYDSSKSNKKKTEGEKEESFIIRRLNEIESRELALILYFFYWALLWIGIPFAIGYIIALLMDGGYTFFSSIAVVISIGYWSFRTVKKLSD